MDVLPSLLRLSSLGLFASAIKDNSIEDGWLELLPNSLKDYRMTSIGVKMRECMGLKFVGT